MSHENHSTETERALNEAFAALAVEDRRVEVPPRVEAAVMRAWDLHRVRESDARRTMRRWRRLLWPAAALTSVGLALVMVLFEGRSSQPTVAETANPPGRPPSMHSRELVSARHVGLVLAADPIVDPDAVRVVRMRIPRTSLVNFGIPISDPEAGGVVELELLVGEDGIARSIRRVTAPGVQPGQE